MSSVSRRLGQASLAAAVFDRVCCRAQSPASTPTVVPATPRACRHSECEAAVAASTLKSAALCSPASPRRTASRARSPSVSQRTRPQHARHAPRLPFPVAVFEQHPRSRRCEPGHLHRIHSHVARLLLIPSHPRCPFDALWLACPSSRRYCVAPISCREATDLPPLPRSNVHVLLRKVANIAPLE